MPRVFANRLRRRMILLPIALVGLAALAACAPTSVLNATADQDGERRLTDLSYGPHPRQSLDLYLPRGVEPDAPLVVFFYGGAWQSGSKARYRFVGRALAERGFVVAIPDYRLYPEVRFPAFVEDGAAALAFLTDPDRSPRTSERPVVLAGHSAGAHTALLLTLDRRYLDGVGLDADRSVTAAIGLAGPYNFAPIKGRTIQRIFAPADPVSESQPIAFARGDAPPILLIHGTSDSTVLPRNSRTLATAVQTQGGTASLIEYENVGHAPLVGAIARPLRWLAPTLEDMARFIAGLD